MKLLIDWSVICHGCWHVMRSPNYEARTDIEAAEFAYNLAATMLYYQQRFQPEEILFALDSREGYWRHDVTDSFYKKHALVQKHVDDESNEVTYFLEYDLRVYSLKYVKGPNKWVSKKLTKAEREDIPEPAEKVKYKDVPEEIKKFFPRYKGHRKESSWDYETTREEWHELCSKIVKNLAGAVGAKIVKVDKAEADDIAKVYADVYSAHETVMLTTDSDWSQLLIDHMFLKLYNPTKREWVETNAEEAEFALAKKLLCGDSSDNILGVHLVGAKATIGPKAAEKLILDTGIKNVYNELETIADLDSLYRNYELIFLDNIPEKIEKRIEKEIKSAKPVKLKKPMHFSHFGVTKKDELALKGEAKKDREVDLEDERIGDD